MSSLRFFIVAALATVASLNAQNLFENDGRSARVVGLGGPHLIASPDPVAASWNPALLAAMRDAQFIISPNNVFSLSTLGAAGFWPQIGGVGVTLMRFDSEGDQHDRVSFGWGKSIGSYLSGGLSIHGHRIGDENFTTMSLGVILHPFGDRLPVSTGSSGMAFHTPFSPYRFALSFQASDLSLGSQRLDAYYKASAALRIVETGLTLVSTFEWQNNERITRLGLSLPVINSFAIYSGVTDFESDRAAIGAAYYNERYAFDLVYSFSEKHLLGGLSVRLGPNPISRASRHLALGKKYAKSKDFRSALREIKSYQVYEPHHENAKKLVAVLSSKVDTENSEIKKLLREADQLERQNYFISSTMNYLKVLKIDRGNQVARKKIETLQPRINIYTTQLFRRGVQAFEEGNYERAQKAFDTILLVRDNHAGANEYLGRLTDIRHQEAEQIFLQGLGYYIQKNFKQALVDFEKAQELNSNHPEVASYIQKTQSEIEQQKNRIQTLLTEAIRFERREQFINAYKLYRQVLDLNPDHENARRKMRSLQTQIDNFVANRMNAGEQAFKRGDFDRADRHFSAVLTMSPKHREARRYRQRIVDGQKQLVENHFRNAMGLFEAREWQQSVEAFERVLEIEPTHKLALRKRSEALSLIDLDDLFARGKSYYERGKYYEAMEAFDRVVAKDPNNREARKYLDDSQNQLHFRVEHYFNRGLAYYANEDYESAILEWGHALALNPNHTQSYEYREQAKLKLEALEKLTSQN